MPIFEKIGLIFSISNSIVRTWKSKKTEIPRKVMNNIFCNCSALKLIPMNDLSWVPVKIGTTKTKNRITIQNL